MSTPNRVAVIALVAVALVSVIGLLAFASIACPGPLPGQACPGAGTNRGLMVGLASLSSALLVTPFAFLAEFAIRRRIVYRGAWPRAARRGVLAAGVVAALAGLRLAGVLSPPGALFVLSMAAAIEWFAVRRIDLP